MSNILPPDAPRPWSRLVAGAAFPIHYKGHGQVVQNIWYDPTDKILQAHAPAMRDVQDLDHKEFWLPWDAWEAVSDRVELVEICVRSNVTCFRLSGDYGRNFGEVRSHRYRGNTDYRWSVPMNRWRKVTLRGREPVQTQLHV